VENQRRGDGAQLFHRRVQSLMFLFFACFPGCGAMTKRNSGACMVDDRRAGGVLVRLPVFVFDDALPAGAHAVVALFAAATAGRWPRKCSADMRAAD
jgi:hypothetical protein